MGPFRLAQDLGIPREMARQMIEQYFQRYQGVRSYVEKIPEIGRQQGYVSTLLGRKRFLPDLHSRNRNVRQFAERTAINTPIQGTAADIMKVAMIRIDALLQQRQMPARMILQVHDELIFEVASDAEAELATLVQQEMESAVSLHVPLVVQVGLGENWDELH
jgi:DNA polymerase-1